ncbi:hypothetical protein HDU67_009916 [Dinochytrium kinnereticum]|nr:hypothetical protein HDU67_009916 [Dinochytrium kinnereticum]
MTRSHDIHPSILATTSLKSSEKLAASVPPVRVSTSATLLDSDDDSEVTAVDSSISPPPTANSLDPGFSRSFSSWLPRAKSNSSSMGAFIGEAKPTTRDPKGPAAFIQKHGRLSDVLLYAIKGGGRSFALALGLRGGFSFLMALLKVYRGKMTLANAFKMFYGPDALRFAKMVGSFSFLWKLILNCLHFANRKREVTLQSDRTFSFVAGSVAGLSVLFETHVNRVAVMQQLGIRSLQAYYNHLHARSLINVPHGDSLLFMLACGSILYGYSMAPSTIPKEYYSWMIKTARMPAEMLLLNRTNVRSLETTGRGVLDLDQLSHAIHKHGGMNAWKSLNATHRYIADTNGQIPVLPCSVMHPSNDSCVSYSSNLFLRVTRMMAPVNATINIVPLLLFKAREVLRSPVSAASRTVVSTLRSSVFLAAYVTTFQSGICVHRELIRRGILKQDHKFVYYLLGFISGWSIFLEKRSRRAELVLYCLPKALESLYMVLLRRKLLIHVPGSEVIATCLAMGNLMSLYRCEPEAFGGFMSKIMDRMVGKY